jgi:acyl-CoA synthetase (AMP-forming)/AMP-acid ligase II
VTTADTQLDDAAVIQWCRDNMANYKVPRSVRFLQEFPMNAGGKVLKNELRELAAQESGEGATP